MGEAFDRLTGQPVQNLPGAVVGEEVLAVGINPNAPNHGVISKENRGFGVDLNDNGRYDAGQDAVLAFDSNHDGTIDKREVERTNAILSAQSGSADTDNDGHVSRAEARANFSYRAQYAGIDKDHDGKLSNTELKAAGAQAWVDSDRDGKIDKGENQDISKIKTGNVFERQETRISEVNPDGKTTIHQKQEIFKSPGFPHLIPHGKTEGKLGQAAKEAVKDFAEAARHKQQPASEPKLQNKIEHKIDHKK